MTRPRPSLPSRCMRNVVMFFEYIWLAWYGTSAAGFDGPRIVTPLWTTRLVGPGQLAVAAALGREVDDHRARRHGLDHLGREQGRGALDRVSARSVMTTSLAGDDLQHHLALAAIEGLVLCLGVAALVFRVGRLERQLDEPSRRGSAPAPSPPAGRRRPRSSRRAAAPTRSPAAPPRPRRRRTRAPATPCRPPSSASGTCGAAGWRRAARPCSRRRWPSTTAHPCSARA